MDRDWREMERRWQASPGDQEALHRAIFARRRSGVPVPGWMLDEREFPARSFESALPLTVSVLLPDGRPVAVGRTPGSMDLPPHRMLWVQHDDDDLDALADELVRQEIPGLSVGTGIEDGDLAPLARLGHLNRLDLSGCVRLSTLESVAGLGELTTLRLWQCRKLPNGALANLASAEALTTLDLTGCWRLRTKGLEHLARLSDLRALSCAGLPELRNKALDALTGLERLTSLDLRRCERLTDGAIPRLAAMRELTVLNLSFCIRLTAKGLAPLVDHPNLSVLYLHGCDMQPEAALAVLRPLTRCDIRV